MQLPTKVSLRWDINEEVQIIDVLFYDYDIKNNY